MSPRWSRQPKRQVPEPVGPPQHGSANPMFTATRELSAFRWRIVMITLGLLTIGLLGYAVYGPWFTVRNIFVSGTHEINPASLKQVTAAELKQWRWGIIPQENLWLLSRQHVSSILFNKIRQRLSIEQVKVIKRNRHDLEIAVVERTPIAVWKTNQSQGSIDRTGVIINTLADTGGLPIILDQGNKSWSVDQQVLTEPVMKAFITLHDAFTTLGFTVENYQIPVPTCPTKVVDPGDQNTNSTKTSENTNSNSSISSNINEKVVINNVNTSPTNGNTNISGPIVVQTECDVAALAKASQEIHVKLKDGPLVLFDRHQDLKLAVETVKRLLTDQVNAGATYIDIRFQERVYIK